MPISKDGSGTVVETPSADFDQFQRTGVHRADQFALCDKIDRLKQLKVDLTDATAQAVVTVKAGAAGTVNLTLPTSSGTLALTGGGGGNSFTTIQPDAGTSPVASSSSDTLTLTSAADLTITGNSGTKTISYAVAQVGGSTAANVHAAELLANAATDLNTASTLVKRDGSGNFTAGTVTAALTGNASTATTATNATNVATTSTSTNASFFPLFVASSTNGNQAASLGTGVTINPSTNEFNLAGGGLFSSTNGTETVKMGASSGTRLTLNNSTHASSTFLTYATNTGGVGIGVGAFNNNYCATITQSNSSTNLTTGIVGGAYTLPALNLRNSSSTAGNYSAIIFTGSSDNPTSYIAGVNKVHTTSSEDGEIHFGTTKAGTRQEVAIIDKTGQLALQIAGSGLSIKEGSNAKMGSSVLTAGAATVSTTAVTANSRIFLTSNADGGTPGWLRVSARSAGTSFTITSSSGTDTSTVAWIILEPS